MKIAFIGLGIMGSRMATNLLKNNVKITVYNRSQAPVQKLVELGATAGESIEKTVKDANIIFSMLSTPEVVQSMFLDDHKAIDYIQKGAIWVDCSTVNPSFTAQMAKEAAKRNVHFVDAPVAGTKPHAENAELVFFIGAKKAQLEIIEPYLAMMGKKTMQVGEVGKGSSFKMLVNLLLAQSMVIFSESILLGEKMGLDKQFLLDMLPNLVVAAPFTKFKAKMIESDDYEVQFPLEWMYKDLQLATTTAYEHQHPLFLASLTKDLYAKAIQEGLSRSDFAAIHQSLEGMQS